MADASAWDMLSTETAQVVFCDLQRAIVKHSRTTSAKSLQSAAGALFELARLFSLPALISLVPEGVDRPNPIPELSDETGYAAHLVRTTASLFGDPTTAQALARSGRRVLIVSGFMLEAVVLDTVLDARAAGYDVLLPVDACGSPSARTERAVLRQMESAGAIPTSVTSLGTKLCPDFTTANGQRMFEIVQGITFD